MAAIRANSLCLQNKANMNDTSKVALVTGASRGIGREIALALGTSGYHVIALARTVGGLEELDDDIRQGGGEAATLVPLDLTDFDGIDRLGAAVYERWGHLDVLIANAGVLGPTSPVSHVKPVEWSKTFDINVTANYRLIRSLDPLLRTAPAGRAVFLSSGAAHKVRAYTGPYAVSKAALEMLALTYAQEVSDTPVRVNVINPGPMRTDMRAQFMPGEDPQSVTPASELVPLVTRLLEPGLTLHGEVVSFKEWHDGAGPRGL